MSEFSIRQLTENDWFDFQQVRLESLAKHPEYFAPSQDETKLTSPEWIERLSNKNTAHFGLFHDAILVGITGIMRENNNSSSERALMMASYIKDEYRGKNLSRLFYEARIDWAKNEKNIKILLIFHREGNLISRNANQRFGFKYLSSFKKTYLDGTEGVSFCYELRL
jgi:RimJ/RimL family protein N-acetyltransferase